jgi:hypothetical protein
MTFLDAIEIVYLNQTERMLDEMHREDPGLDQADQVYMDEEEEA